MSIKRFNASRDQNELDIVNALRHVGASVLRINEGGAPDLLVGKWGRNHLLEVKRPLGPRGGTGGSDLTEQQQKWHREWQGTVHVVRSPEEALKVISQPPAQVPAKKKRGRKKA